MAGIHLDIKEASSPLSENKVGCDEQILKLTRFSRGPEIFLTRFCTIRVFTKTAVVSENKGTLSIWHIFILKNLQLNNFNLVLPFHIFDWKKVTRFCPSEASSPPSRIQGRVWWAILKTYPLFKRTWNIFNPVKQDQSFPLQKNILAVFLLHMKMLFET